MVVSLALGGKRENHKITKSIDRTRVENQMYYKNV